MITSSGFGGFSYFPCEKPSFMSKVLLGFSDGIDRINETVGRLVSWLTTFLMALVCLDVFIRLIYSILQRNWMPDLEWTIVGQAWIMELEWHFFALIFLLGAGYAYKHDKHVRVDLFYAKFSRRDKALVNIVGNVVFLIPWCIVIAYASFQYAWRSFSIRETSPDPGGLPALYLIKFAITIGLILLLLQAISSTIRAVMDYRASASQNT